jgi:hypothetical protein
VRYSIYAIEEGTQVVVSEAEAPELRCDACGATWLYQPLSYIIAPCPYCEADITLIGGGSAVAEQTNAGSYARDIRGVVRALWSGAIDYDQAFTIMLDTIRLGLTAAWHEGAKECGILPAELSPEERTALLALIANEQSHIGGLLSYVDAGSKKNGGKLRDVLPRADLWGLRYVDAYNRARILACADQKARWTINHVRQVKENCNSCLKLNGKVKRFSYWRREQVQPQNPPNPKLECGGWFCGCGLVSTDEPCTPGPLPNLP